MPQHHGRLSIIPAVALSDARVSRGALHVLGILGCYSDRKGWSWPRQKTIAEKMGVTRQAVSQYLRELHRLGYIMIRCRKEKGLCSQYRLLLDVEVDDQYLRYVEPLPEDESYEEPDDPPQGEGGPPQSFSPGGPNGHLSNGDVSNGVSARSGNEREGNGVKEIGNGVKEIGNGVKEIGNGVECGDQGARRGGASNTKGVQVDGGGVQAQNLHPRKLRTCTPASSELAPPQAQNLHHNVPLNEQKKRPTERSTDNAKNFFSFHSHTHTKTQPLSPNNHSTKGNGVGKEAESGATDGVVNDANGNGAASNGLSSLALEEQRKWREKQQITPSPTPTHTYTDPDYPEVRRRFQLIAHQGDGEKITHVARFIRDAQRHGKTCQEILESWRLIPDRVESIADMQPVYCHLQITPGSQEPHPIPGVVHIGEVARFALMPRTGSLRIDRRA